MSQSIKQITEEFKKEHGWRFEGATHQTEEDEAFKKIILEYFLSKLQAIRAETLDEVENLDLMKEEKLIALPVMQIQEQNNYDKEQRNELRAWLRKELSGLRNGLSTTHGNPENPIRGEDTK